MPKGLSKALCSETIASFCGNRSFGNRHQVALVDRFSDSAEGCGYSSSVTPLIYVEVCIDGQNIAQLRYYQYGREVQNCGSGTLAAAALLHKCARPPVLGYRNRMYSGRFLQQFSLVGYSQESLEKFRKQAGKKGFWRFICRQTIKEVFEVSGKNYIIVELCSPEAVKNAHPRINALAKFPLALIITAKSRQPGVDYVMRYFAPHYGNDEDSATGSANTILLQYWWQRFNKRSLLRGLQLSRRGGEFFGCANSTAVEIYGFTAEALA